MKFCQHGSNLRRKFQAVLGYAFRESDRNTPFPLLHSLRGIGHRMSIGNLILGVNNVTVSYLIHYDSLLQYATDIITKCDSYFITKCHRNLLQNASGFVLQNATVITNCDDFIIKCNSYYKMRRLLLIATVQAAQIKSFESSFNVLIAESVVQRCKFKKLFLKIPQNSQENTCARVSFIVKLQTPFLQITSGGCFYYQHSFHVHYLNFIP